MAGRARRSAAEVAEGDAGEMWSSGGVNGASEVSRQCMALKWMCWD